MRGERMSQTGLIFASADDRSLPDMDMLAEHAADAADIEA